MVAKAVSEAERKKLEADTHSHEDKLLIAMNENESASMSRLAELNEWFLGDMKPNKPLVQRTLKNLQKDKLVRKERGTWVLTDRGKKVAEKAKLNADLAGARYG